MAACAKTTSNKTRCFCQKNKNGHPSWRVDRAYGWDWGVDFYLLYPIKPVLNQSISVWFLDVWLSTSLLLFWVPQHWESLALFCLLAPVKSCRSNLGFSWVQKLELLAAWRPTPSLLLIQQLHKTVSPYVVVGMQIHVWKLWPQIHVIGFRGKEGPVAEYMGETVGHIYLLVEYFFSWSFK